MCSSDLASRWGVTTAEGDNFPAFMAAELVPHGLRGMNGRLIESPLGYKYPHEYGGWVNQEYLPQKLVEMQRKYYYPNDRGSESGFKKYLETLENLKKKGK